MMLAVEEKEGAVLFSVAARPRSSKRMIAGELDGMLKVMLKAPPVDGEANKECCRYFSRLLGVARSRVQIVAGFKGKKKRVKVDGISVAEFMEIMNPHIIS